MLIRSVDCIFRSIFNFKLYFFQYVIGVIQSLIRIWIPMCGDSFIRHQGMVEARNLLSSSSIVPRHIHTLG